MTRWCHHYACPKDILDHIQYVLLDDEDEDYDALWEDVLRHFPASLPIYGVNLIWEEIHRCLTEDFSQWLDFDKGDYPLRLCIHGGDWLRDVPNSVTLVYAEEVPELCRAMEEIDHAWWKERLPELKAAGVRGYKEREMKDREIDEVWTEFQELLTFYHQAEKLRLPVVCTISH